MPGMNPYNRDRWYQPVPGTPVASTQAGIPGYVDPPYSNVPTASAFQPGYNPNYAPGASVGSPLANPVGASGAAAATPFVPTTNPTGGTSATTTGTSGGTGATSGSGTIANGPMYGTPGTDQMSLWDPGRFMTGYERALLEAGINPASGNPGAQMAENNAYRAQSRFFADTLLGNNPGTDTQGYIRNAVGNMSNTGYGQTTPFLAKLRQMLSDLANPNFQMPLDQAGAYTYARTLRNGSNEDQVLNAIMGLLPNYAGLRNMRDYLQQRAEQQMAMNPSQGGTFMDALLQILA